MKNKLLILLIVATIPFLCLSQSEINNIDKSVQDIKNNLSTLKKVERINSKDGCSFIFFKEKDLLLITVKALEPTTEKNVAWYFVEGQLAYAETNWYDMETKNSVFNESCYFHKGHLISWTNSREKTIDPGSDEFKKMDAGLVAYGLKIREEALK